MEERIVHIFLSLDEEIYVGKLYAQKINAKEIYSIELSSDFLKSKYSSHFIKYISSSLLRIVFGL